MLNFDHNIYSGIKIKYIFTRTMNLVDKNPRDSRILVNKLNQSPLIPMGRHDYRISFQNA